MVSGHVDRRERTSAYAIVCAFWLTLVAVVFLVFWLSGRASLETTGLIAGLLTIVGLASVAIDAFMVRKGRIPLCWDIFFALGVVASITLPVWGSERFWVLPNRGCG